MRVGLRAAIIGIVVAATAACATVPKAQNPITLAGIDAYNAGDFPTAFRLLKQATDIGDAEAEANLGYMYARGQGVMEDQLEAYRLYQLAADQGDGEGMNALGYKYLFGTGVPIGTRMAVYWFCRSVSKGNPRAMTDLAAMLSVGDGIMKDVAEARRLWERAAKMGQANAMFNLGFSYRELPDPDFNKSERWISDAAAAGQPLAQDFLRARGYFGPLPPVRDTLAMMTPAPKNAVGFSTACGATSA